MTKNRTLSLAAWLLASAGCGFVVRSRAAKWRRDTDELVEKLKQTATPRGDAVCFRDFDGLPKPVAAFFRFALRDGQALIRAATIRHEGKFLPNNKWIPFSSTQDFSAHPAGFVWDANMKMNPFLSVRVRDSYVSGRGAMSAKILSLVSMMDAHDDRNLDEGALMRYLAEAAWFPTALLPSENLKWTAIDDDKALATLRDGDTVVSLEFSFKPSGEMSGFFAPARFYSSTEGELKSFPWSGRLWNYQPRNGMMIPLEGEVAWQKPEGPSPYYRAQIVEAQYH